MFKTNEEIIVIQAKATAPIPTGVVFWSHDKGTAKMLFQLQKDYVSQTLSEGTIVPICLDFVGGRHIYHAVIEDAINGIVSIVLEDNILGYQGRVEGSIYIELPDSRSLDTAGRFTFQIKRSPIDEDVPELENYYWQGFNEIMNQYHQTIAEIETESERLLNKLQARILTLEEKLDNVELRARFKTAWSWSVDGTGRFTKVYPRENLFIVKEWEKLPERPYPTYISRLNIQLEPNTDYTLSTNIPNWAMDKTTCDLFLLDSKTEPITRINGVAINKPRTITTLVDGIIVIACRSYEFSSGAFWAKLEKGATPTIYTPAPSDDPINAYPTYKGISIVDSDNPADYSWQAEDNTIAKKTDLTKDKVGLGNVDNYSTATQAEAEAGTATNKFMTPALVFKAIAKWVQGKFVSATGNETILGTKNFQDGLQVKGNLPVLTKSVNDFASVDKNNNASVISDGSMKLSRRGDIVYLTGSFQLSAAKYNQAVWFDVPSWAAPIDVHRMYWSSGGNFYLLTFDPSTINNIICTGNVAKDAWLTGSFCWLARDPY